MQGLLAAGEDLDAAKWMKDGISPYSALAALQKVDGPFADGGLDDSLSTWQAVPALLGRSLPLRYAGLVVDYGDGRTETACVSFSEPQITGLDLLDRSAIPYAQDGGIVNQLRDLSAAGTMFWSYWYQDAGAWQLYPNLAGDAAITDGSVDGWHYASWETWPPDKPTTIPTLQEICGLQKPFVPFNRGPDPDRLVAVAPSFAPGNSVAVTVPFGSDLNANGDVALEWRLRGQASWSAATTYRADGYFTATLPIEPANDYEWRASLTDPEGVQYGSMLYGELEIPFHAYLSTVCR
jgi:hypothetical protein